MPRSSATKTMSAFNNGLPLEAVVLSSTESLTGRRIGIVSRDAGHRKVWIGHDITPTYTTDDTHFVTLPKFPSKYGKWVSTSIGGVSATVRRVGAIRALHCETPVVMFAVKASSSTSVCEAFHTFESKFTIGDTEHDETYNFVTEIVIHKSEDVALAAAIVARVGAIPMLEDSSLNAKRCLGIERLDRISAKVITTDTMIDSEEGLFGLRRGTDNWKFSWIPREWQEVPITWDHMVRNVISQPIESLPQPLRQHVAKTRLDQGDFYPIGSHWELCPEKDIPSQDILQWNESLDDDFPLQHIYKRVVQLDKEDQHKVLTGSSNVSIRVPLNCVTLINGMWHRPVNTRAFLDRCIPKGDKGEKRWVTPHLTSKQSKQLIEVFYLLTVECIDDPLQQEVCKLILFRYMIERGYTARWIGKYDQDGNHVGNGDTFRKFSRLSQYAPDRLPTDVLNKLCGRNGKLKNKGSKGTRSKYKQKAEKKRYVPKRRLKRTKQDERRML